MNDLFSECVTCLRDRRKEASTRFGMLVIEIGAWWRSSRIQNQNLSIFFADTSFVYTVQYTRGNVIEKAKHTYVLHASRTEHSKVTSLSY